MEKSKYTAIIGQDIDSLLDAINIAPMEKHSIMALLAETYINGMKMQDKLIASTRATQQERSSA